MLFGPFVGVHIDCKNVHGMGNLKFTNAQLATAAYNYKNTKKYFLA